MGKILKIGGKKVARVGKAIIKGVADSVFPNIKASFKEKPQAFADEPVKYKFDFWRLFSALTVWILLLLVFLGKINFNDIINVVSGFINEILPK
jgi:hypothetical protein